MSAVVKPESICNICGKEFMFPYLLERHKLNKKPCKIKSTEFQCLHCGICCVNKYTLTKHLDKCKKNTKTEDNKEDDKNTDINIMKTLFINFIEELKAYNASNDLLDSLIKLIPSTSTINNNTTNNNSIINNKNHYDYTTNNITNTTNNDNFINNNINNNINIDKLVIYPFGYENIDNLSDADCLRMLKITKNIIPIIEKIYSQPHNHNFIRNNANKDIITVLESDLEIKTYKSQEFYRKLADGTINFLECLLHKYQPRMIFDHQLAILLNIEDLRNIYLDKKDFSDISSFLDANFQKKIQKTFLKNYYDKLAKNSEYKEEGLKQIKDIRKKISKIYKDFNNSTITDDFLQQEIWSRKFKCPETDPDAQYNDLVVNSFESTRRYKFIKERQDEEFAYFREHGISIGNLYKYRLILLERKKYEIMILENKYVDITSEQKNRIIENIINVMINDTFNRLINEIKTIRLIRNEEPEYLENNSNDDVNIEDELELDIELGLDKPVSEPILNVELKLELESSNTTSQKENISIPAIIPILSRGRDIVRSHEELIADGYVLDANGDYVKKIPKFKYNLKHNI